ncbi:LuxR C-terminal-related transcriptional regulator [Streptomyces sp. NPDC057939]|uniref:LuxR C-terminal-related transcriptional regulator n=1 Tax=Streptomyces sp. NPDC057939 TaxID=3346284 RepID=UPI0036E26364
MTGHQTDAAPTTDPAITVAAVDDHAFIRHGLQYFFADNAPDIRLAAVETSVGGLLRRTDGPASVVLLDLLLPDEPDVALNVRRIRAIGSRVVILTSDSRPGIVRSAIDAGALGLVLKGDPEQSVVEAVRAAHRNDFSVSSRLAHAIVTDPRAGVRLSARERQVLSLIAQGKPRRLVAKEMQIAEHTLPSYLKRAAKRYAAVGHPTAGAQELVAFALRDGHIGIELPGDDTAGAGSPVAEDPEAEPGAS